MATKQDFTPSEWQVLSAAPRAITRAMRGVWDAGLDGEVAEMAAEQRAFGTPPAGVADDALLAPLAREAAALDRAHLAAACAEWPDERAAALGLTRRAGEILRAKATAAQVHDYIRWAITLAATVAVAGRAPADGEATLGAAEQQLVDELAEAFAPHRSAGAAAAASAPAPAATGDAPQPSAQRGRLTTKRVAIWLGVTLLVLFSLAGNPLAMLGLAGAGGYWGYRVYKKRSAGGDARSSEGASVEGGRPAPAPMAPRAPAGAAASSATRSGTATPTPSQRFQDLLGDRRVAIAALAVVAALGTCGVITVLGSALTEDVQTGSQQVEPDTGEREPESEDDAASAGGEQDDPAESRGQGVLSAPVVADAEETEEATATREPTDEPEPTDTDEPSPTSAPPTDTPAPPTATAVPPTPAPPHPADPNGTRACADFPDVGTMQAWRSYWIQRGVGNPGGLDGDGDGTACEDGEGGRPAAAPPTSPPPPPPTAPPPPPPPPAQPPGGCCKYCTPGVSKPCGDSCIRIDYNCHKGQGCACGG